jgi:probable rRNA maturation factor
MEREKMEVLIDNRQSKHKIPLKKVRQQAKVILSALDKPNGELSILIVDDAQITVLNKEYLKREGPTNVMAFPMHEGNFADISPQLLGDVVVSIETACQEGKMMGITTEERFTQLIVHGILHLLGYDHERTEEEALRMEIKSNVLLNLIQQMELG